jgi:hypothetical protein
MVIGFVCIRDRLVWIYPADHIEEAFWKQSCSGRCHDHDLGNIWCFVSDLLLFLEIRYGKNGKAYNISGKRGVQFEFLDGKRLLIGTQKPKELIQALDTVSGKKG